MLLHANVVSEAIEPAPAVRHWLDDQAAERLHLCNVAAAGSMFDIAALIEGKRKDRWTSALDRVLTVFADRILAIRYRCRAPLRSSGRLRTRDRMKPRKFPCRGGCERREADSILRWFHLDSQSDQEAVPDP